jgi:hypothetical protein
LNLLVIPDYSKGYEGYASRIVQKEILHEPPLVNPVARKTNPHRRRLLVFAGIAPVFIGSIDLVDFRHHFELVKILLASGMTGVLR